MGIYYSGSPANSKQIKYTITVNPTTIKEKPSKSDQVGIAKISKGIQLVVEDTIDEIAKYITYPFSYTWYPSKRNGALNNTNWIGQSIFALDFDDGLISVEDALERLHDLHIYPQLWYTTLRSSEALLKFRIVMFLDQPITSLQHHKNIHNAFFRIFKEADKACSNASRFYFGGQVATVLHYEPIPTQLFLDNLCVKMISLDNGRSRSLKSSSGGDKSNNGENRRVLYSNYKNNQNSPGCNEKLLLKTSYLVGGIEININVARKKIKILDEFLNGKWLYHNEIFGLATNMKYMKGGLKLMKNIMQKYNNLGITNYSADNFNTIVYVNNTLYHPTAINSFSSYPEDEEHFDLINAVRNVRGHIEVLEDINKIPLDTATVMFKEAFNSAIKSNNNKVYLFCLPTAIGKTEALTSLTGVTIATKTNDLKDELADRMVVNKAITPDIQKFENENIYRKLEYFYRIGQNRKATAMLFDIANNSMGEYSKSDIMQVQQYVQQLKESYESEDTVITTHKRAIHSDFKHNTVIFDEDPLDMLIDLKQMDLTDLRKIYYEYSNTQLQEVIDYLESADVDIVNDTPMFNIIVEDIIENIKFSSIESNIFDFFASKHYIRDKRNPHIIHYVIKRSLPANKKIIILSATLPLPIYKMLLGDDIEIVNLQDVEQKGQIIQYTKRSCSRHALNRYVKDISEIVGDKPVITFKDFGAEFNKPVKEMYFGNCSGYDSIKGKDLVVVGTPHQNNIKYLLTAKVVDLSFNTPVIKMSYQKITFNGFRFMFNTYENEILRNIQLSSIESELIQAIGRARTLRFDCTVEVYSNFPLRISKKFIF